MPGADVGKRAQPVDAGVGPEIDEDDLAAQRRRSQRRRIEPFIRPFYRGQPGLTGSLEIEKPMEERDSYSRRCCWLLHVRLLRKSRNRGTDCNGEYRGGQELVRF